MTRILELQDNIASKNRIHPMKIPVIKTLGQKVP